MKLPPSKMLAAARYHACERTPYFAAAILAMQPYEVPNGTLSRAGTFGITSRGVMYYEPAALERWTVPQIAAVLIHEVSHWLRDHSGRAAALSVGPDDRERWNIAADAEINDDLLEMQLDLPDGGGVQPKSIGCATGKTAEEYYAALKAKQGSGKPAKSQTPGFGGQSSCGSGAGGDDTIEKTLGLAGGDDGAGDGDDDDALGPPPGHNLDEVEAVRQATATAISDAAERGIGNIPAGMKRWADERTKPPKVSWAQKLAVVGRSVVAHRAGASDYAFTRVSRRQGGLGFGSGRPVAPALIARTPRVAIAIDTSGSMGGDEIERAVIEAEGVMRAIGSDVDFLSCDAAVHGVQKVRTARELVQHLHGGGGTSFVPVFQEIDRWRAKPDVLVFITDGCGPAPARAPKGYSVIWVLVGSYRTKPFAAGGKPIEWGSFIEVDED